jgi:AcrR family transcriptional regulator
MAKKTRKPAKRFPKQERARATVDAILEGAARVLVREGYDRASTNRIAEVAGVNIGSLYQYFPNKDALVASLIDRHLEKVQRLVRGHLLTARTASPGEGIREMEHAHRRARLA